MDDRGSLLRTVLPSFLETLCDYPRKEMVGSTQTQSQDVEVWEGSEGVSLGVRGVWFSRFLGETVKM